MNLLAVVVLWGLWFAVDGCTCPYLHPQTMACNHVNIIVKFRVRFACIPPSGSLYGITVPVYIDARIFKIYKRSPDYKGDVRIYSYWCGSMPEMGKTYIWAGYETDKGVSLWMCDKRIVMTGDNGLEGQQFVHKVTSYMENCECEIEICKDGYSTYHCPRIGRRKGCHYSYSDPNGQCYYDHSLCKKTEKGTCAWNHYRSFKECTGEDQKMEDA